MFGTKVEEAAAQIEKLAARELLLLQQRHSAVVKARAVENEVGNAFLDGETEGQPGPPLDAVAKAQAEISAIDGGLRACRARRLDAVKTKRLAEAAAIRKQVGELRDQAAAIKLRVGQAIALINAIEGIACVVSPTMGGVALSQQLEGRADEMERRVAGLEAEIPRAGVADVFDATTPAPLLEAVLHHESDGPSAAEVLDWVEACEIRSGRLFGDHSRRYRLTWKNGKIDVGESYIQVAGLSKISEGVFGGRVHETGSDIFKAAAA